jgi:HAD superfamily hydrolase (TIGR01509 family)
MRSLGLPCSASTVARYDRINGALWAAFRRGETTQRALARERFRRLLLELDEDPGRAGNLGETYLACLSRRGDRMPGCLPLLRKLRGRYRLAVVSNGIDRVQRSRIRASGLAPFFESVVTSQSCGYAKPDPRILQVALDALDVAPRHAVYVGDDPATDGGASRAAGVPFVWMDRGRATPGRRPRRSVTALAQLPGLLDGRTRRREL